MMQRSDAGFEGLVETLSAFVRRIHRRVWLLVEWLDELARSEGASVVEYELRELNRDEDLESFVSVDYEDVNDGRVIIC